MAHGLGPIVAAPQHQIPVEVEITVAAEAREFLLAALDEALHLVEAGGRIKHMHAGFLEALHLIEAASNSSFE